MLLLPGQGGLEGRLWHAIGEFGGMQLMNALQ
jgi:hypothetical protein